MTSPPKRRSERTIERFRSLSGGTAVMAASLVVAAFSSLISALTAVVVLVVFCVLLAVWLVLFLTSQTDETPPDLRPYDRLRPHSEVWRIRVRHVEAAPEILAQYGKVVICGLRDVGTSTVADLVVHQAAAAGSIDPSTTMLFDLRGFSSHEPDDQSTVARRLLTQFELAYPAGGDHTLDLAAQLLVKACQDKRLTLVLDNVSPGQLDWLLPHWPQAGPQQPILVIAGNCPTGHYFDLPVEPLTPDEMRAMFEFEMRGYEIGSRDGLDAVLLACLGRPRAVKDLTIALKRPGAKVSIPGLAEPLTAVAVEAGENPLVEIWTELLRHIEEDLSEEAMALMYALAQLPVTDLPEQAIASMERTIAGGSPTGNPRAELEQYNLVQRTNRGYRVPEEVRLVIAGTGSGARNSAVPAARAIRALVHDYAAGATAMLEQRSEQAAERLTPFVAGAYPADLLPELIDDLNQLLDQLQSWLHRQHRPEDLLKLARRMAELAAEAGRPDIGALAQIRQATAHRWIGDLDAAADCLAEAERLMEVAPQQEVGAVRCHELGRLRLESAGEAPKDSPLHQQALDEAAAAFAEALRLFPDKSHRARCSAYINLAAVELRRGDPAEALRYLTPAESLADRDPATLAQVNEHLGHAYRMRDDRDRALRHYEAAWLRYTDLGDADGVRRCKRHLTDLGPEGDPR
ncbi:tetratricopeptide repeat protein [Flindersiella endophytica]